jgi:hypothetical protein
MALSDAGIGKLSHTKKAQFWRELADKFPTIIDFLCCPDQNLGQVAG